MYFVNFSEWCIPNDYRLIAKLRNENEKIKIHKHDFFEIVYANGNGTVDHVINGSKHQFGLGDLCVMKPYDAHYFTNYKEKFVHRDVLIRTDLFKESCDFIDQDLYDKILNSSEAIYVKLNSSDIESLEKHIREMNNCLLYSQPKQTRRALENMLVVKLLEKVIINMYKVSREYPTWIEMVLQRFDAIEYVKGGLTEILKDINYDRSYVCHAFKKYMGCSMSAYLLKVRLDIAASLLSTTDYTIEAICETIGLTGITYFSVAFKKKFGVSPGAFRRNKIVDNNEKA